MRLSRWPCLLAWVWLCAACAPASPAPASPSTSAIPRATAEALGPAATALPFGGYALSLVPRCQALERLNEPLAFVWPQVERRLKELEGSDWGYFRCPQAREAVSAFYQAQMTQPPFNMRETFWVDRAEGTLGVYYHAAFNVWAYLWVVPQPGDEQAAYVIVAIADGMAFEPDC